MTSVDPTACGHVAVVTDRSLASRTFPGHQGTRTPVGRSLRVRRRYSNGPHV
jgi:hypothetical protein